MATYKGRSTPREVTIGIKTIIVDSKLEERVIRELDANGYSGRWEKPLLGLNVGRYNYTPDLELAVQHEGKMHRALVEIKPAKDFFTPYISKRMRGVAKHYYTKLLLLYADKEKQWYKVDIKTGRLDVIALPPPSDVRIEKLYSPLTLSARRIRSHRYRKRFNPLMFFLGIIADILEAFIAPPKRRRYRKRYR